MQASRGIRTRELLIAAMAVVIASVTLTSLLLVRHRLTEQITDNLSQDLIHSVRVFQDLRTQRLNALDRENALLADLPSLKALMTTNDTRTIEDAAVEFWRVSGTGLFALANTEGNIVAAYTEGPYADQQLRTDLRALLTTRDAPYLVSEGRLFACSARPLYFGNEASGALLGYVISGFAIDRNMVERISQGTTVEATFLSGGRPVASTLAPAVQSQLASYPLSSLHASPALSMKLGNERYLGIMTDLSSKASAPLQLVVLKSFDQAEHSIQQVDRLVLFAGLLAMLLGTVLMMALSHAVTRPLEDLAAGVRAFGVGDSSHLLPYRGTKEVRELSTSFASMRREIQRANRALVESERLATIGRMASSVSHDLRHYLAAVYANAEFLASAKLTDAERMEILSDIHTAVYGTTELLESMLIFSRTGTAIRRSPELIASLLERAMTLVRAHPDASNVILEAHCEDPAATSAHVEAKQIERAIYNLLLNACQSGFPGPDAPRVTATLHVQDNEVVLEVADNGAGVPQNIRNSLFEPFVSEGKQKGSGLGLTLSQCIAAEHGGNLLLLSSRHGETIFCMTLPRGATQELAAANSDSIRVLADETKL